MRELAVYERPAREPRPVPTVPVVLVHGSMDRGASFIKAARQIPDIDLTLYDRRGYGRSASAAPARSLDDQVDDLSAVIGGRVAVVVGHSIGGLVALTLASRRPEQVLAVGAFEAPMPWASWWPTSSAGGDAVAGAETESAADVAERFMRRMIGGDRWERLPRATRESRRAEGVALLADLRSVRSGGEPFHPADLAVAVVAGRGTESDAHHRRAADTLAAEVAGADLVVIEGAGHGAHYTHPRDFARFVRRVAARADR